MKREIAVSILVAALSSAPAFAVDKKAVVEHVQETYSFPPGVEVELGDPKPSEVQGFDVMDMKISRGEAFHQTEKLYISKDGRYYVMGGFKDLKFSPDQERMKKMDLAGSPVRGNKKAPVKVVEYTDFQCPYCQMGYKVMRDEIMKQYGSKIQWVYKSFPLKSIHPWAESAAIGAECAKQQSEAKFWKVHDSLFDQQKQITVRNIDEKLTDLAKAEGLDSGKFKACYAGKETLKVVDRDLGEVDALGINGAPAFVINGRLVSGADGQRIKQIVEEYIKKSGKS